MSIAAKSSSSYLPIRARTNRTRSFMAPRTPYRWSACATTATSPNQDGVLGESVGSAEVGSAKECSAEVGFAEVGSKEVSSVKIEIRKVYFLQISARQPQLIWAPYFTNKTLHIFSCERFVFQIGSAHYIKIHIPTLFSFVFADYS
jgi:hypothetical protein